MPIFCQIFRFFWAFSLIFPIMNFIVLFKVQTYSLSALPVSSDTASVPPLASPFKKSFALVTTK